MKKYINKFMWQTN